MLTSTFIHIPGISRKLERRLWEQGIVSWQQAAAALQEGNLRLGKAEDLLHRYIPKSFHAYDQSRLSFFDRLISVGEAWRVFQDFSHSCVYLDIETTGFSPALHEITVAGLFDGQNYRSYVSGEDLSIFPQELAKHDLVVTFNGSFDLRFVKARWPRLHIPFHIDLRRATGQLGLKGGLKKIEPAFGIKRPRSLSGIGGADAPRLWKEAVAGSRTALDQLIDYNRQDVIHLETIMRESFARLCEQTFPPSVNRRHRARLKVKAAHGM